MYQEGGSGLRGATFLPHYDRLGVSPSLDSDNFLINERWHHSCTGLHKLWYPSIQDMSTWSKFGAHGEHGDVFLFSNLGAL